MYGAILGDIMSWWHKNENDGIFYLVDKEFKFSDYTVMTIAIADALLPLEDYEDSEDDFKDEIEESMLDWINKYLNANPNQHFRKWLHQDKVNPIDGVDNSAAAIISVIPYIYTDSSQVVQLAKWVAEITHSDPQSIENAGMTALAIYYAKMCPKVVFKNNLESTFACDFNDPKGLKNIVFEAIKDFLDSVDLESAINNAIARGGDIRTRAVITGSIAEAFYGMPTWGKTMCNREFCDEDVFNVLDKFDRAARRTFLMPSDDALDLDSEFGNKRIEKAIARFRADDTSENFDRLMDTIHYRMYEGGQLFVPLVIEDRNEVYNNHELSEGDSEYLRVQSYDGAMFIAAFTSINDELDEEFPDTYLAGIKDFLEEFEEEASDEGGIVLNPNDEEKQFALTKPLIKMLLEAKPPENEMWFFRGNTDELKTRTEAIVTPDYEDFDQSSFEDEYKLASAHYVTKAETDYQYVIHTPLLNYRGDNESIIYHCYWYCLELAKKCHIHSITFPIQFCKFNTTQTSDGVEVLGFDLHMALKSWIKRNDAYGMKVFAVVDDEQTDGKGQYLKVDFMGDVDIPFSVTDDDDEADDLDDDEVDTENAGDDKSEVLILIDDIAALSTEAIVNFTDENLSGIDSKIDEELYALAGSKLRKALRKINHCGIGEAIITKGYGTRVDYIIHTAVDDNMSNLDTCYRNCLELAKEYHLHKIAIPITCSERLNTPRRLQILKDIFISTNNFIYKWLKENEDYIMKVTLVVEYEDQRFFKVDKIIVEDKADSNSKETKNLNFNKQKSEAYKDLVIEMQNMYPICKGELSENKVNLLAPYFNGESICREINIYTYCQGLGYADKTPKIKYLLVAQDFGVLLKHGETFIKKIKKINEGNQNIPYIDDEFLQTSNTTKNLIELFKVLGYDISNRYDELFFTNFCLGYRSGKNGGDMTKKIMMESADIFKRLCDILEPKNILCLGRLTFECVYNALTNQNYPEIKNYNELIQDHEDILAQCGEVKTRIYPLTHCGKLGTNNRNRGLPKQSDQLYYQKQDWARIAKDNQ